MSEPSGSRKRGGQSDMSLHVDLSASAFWGPPALPWKRAALSLGFWSACCACKLTLCSAPGMGAQLHRGLESQTFVRAQRKQEKGRPGRHGCCWETFCNFAYRGLVGVPPTQPLKLAFFLSPSNVNPVLRSLEALGEQQKSA